MVANRCNMAAFARHQFETQVQAAQQDLNAIMRKRLARVSKDQKAVLVQRRRKTDEDAFVVVDSLGNEGISLSTGLESIQSQEPLKEQLASLMGLYSDEDVFEAIRNIRLPHLKKDDDSSGYPQMGADDVDSVDQPGDFVTRWNDLASRTQSVKEARRLAKQGIPAHGRARIWDLLVQTEMTLDSKAYANEQCSHLKAQVARYSLLIDRMIISDVSECKSDDTYFVFEEMVQEILLLWSRDEWVSTHAPNALSAFEDGWMEKEVKNVMKGRWSVPVKSYPPNGVLPFNGVSFYAMIVAYIYSELESAYFFKLHTISTLPDGIMALSATFESFLKQLDPLLFLHMTHELACPPITYAFRWLMFGFVGVLDVEQVLVLWDRVMGFDRMEIMSAVAAAIFVFRKERLMAAKSEKDVERALSDLTMIKIIPLLQHYFFIHNTEADLLPKQWKSFTTDARGDWDDDD
ncbi:hypothetical protein HDU98_008133 [Podochytrium sp. JEL0797]|nr:hypothetical protein HDU98_008133 [Podochytrium sp. JEL0797]